MRQLTYQKLFFYFVGLLSASFYILSALKRYYNFWLAHFDYAITFNATQLLSPNNFITEDGLMYVRGVHVLAHNQQYFHSLLFWVHLFNYPHQLLIIANSLAIFSAGIIAYYSLRRNFLTAFCVAVVVWLNPITTNMNTDLVHTEAFALPLLLLMHHSYSKGSPYASYLWAILALLTKVDVAVTVLSYALIVMIAKGEQWSRYRIHGAVIFTLAALLLSFNVFFIIPETKSLTCFLLTGRDIAASGANSVSGWFDPFFNNILNPSFYAEAFLKQKVVHYFLLVLWPILLLGRGAGLFILLPLPGMALNVLSTTDYLISGKFHYDHSTFAAVIIGCIVSIKKYPPRRLTLVGLVAILFSLILLVPSLYRTSPREIFDSSLWILQKNEKVQASELLNDLLPEDTVISADYITSNYLLKNHLKVYSFPNPLQFEYFGVYNVCDGSYDVEFSQLLAPDVVVLEQGYRLENEASLATLKEKFVEISTASPLAPLRIYLRMDSPKYLSLREALEGEFE